jgi:hypothetical protein
MYCCVIVGMSPNPDPRRIEKRGPEPGANVLEG